MLCRVAEHMFWMSRYLERAIAVVRLIDVLAHLELDAGERDAEMEAFWSPLLDPQRPGAFVTAESPVASVATASSTPAALPAPEQVRFHLVFDVANPQSALSCIRRARAAAREVRESISSEMWERLNSLYLSLLDPQVARLADEDSHAFFKRAYEDAVLVYGLADCTLAHDEPWQFIILGKYLERADNVARVLSLQSHLLLGGDPLSLDNMVRWLAVLRSCGSAEAYARYYSLRVEPARMVEFLVLNAQFPQSVRFSVGAASEALREITRGQSGEVAEGPALRALGQLRSRLDHVAIDEVFEEGLDGYLADIQRRIGQVSSHIARAHFRAEPQPVRIAAAARAALIMAAQQQQQQQQ